MSRAAVRLGHCVLCGASCDGRICRAHDGIEVDAVPADPLESLPMQAAETLHEPDEMGVWAESGELVWLPRSRYPKRSDAIRWAMSEWDCRFLEVRALARWMRWEPFTAHQLDGSVAWSEDQWWECEPDAPGAFRVWRLESA